MLHEKLEEAWQARRRAVSISPILQFTPQGLVLGAGTVVVAADGSRQLESMQGREAHMLALLCAAQGKAIPPSVIGNIKRAAKAWSEGDDCLAYIHLAHARLPTPVDLDESAHRLFIVDSFMKAGTRPCAVFEALRLSPQYIDAVEKAYNPAEPRVPAGSGRTSGRWTRDSGGDGSATNTRTSTAAPAGAGGGRPLALLPPAAAAAIEAVSESAPFVFANLSRAALVSLAGYASAVILAAGGAVATFGLLFVPSPNEIKVEGEVADVPGLRYSWNRDELTLHLTYDHAGEQRTFAAYLDGDKFRDEDGREIGRVIGGNKVAIDLFAVLPDLVKKSDEPRLCPAPARDVPGSDRGLQYKDNLARQYEDFLKPLINPDAPTPSGFAYFLPNPIPGKRFVSYDDCQKKTNMLFEFKSYYGGLLTFNSNARQSFLDQSLRQIAASGGRPTVWVFADEQDLLRTKELFEVADKGREYITLVHAPWTTRGTR
jgi:hypothetical protein